MISNKSAIVYLKRFSLCEQKQERFVHHTTTRFQTWTCFYLTKNQKRQHILLRKLQSTLESTFASTQTDGWKDIFSLYCTQFSMCMYQKENSLQKHLTDSSSPINAYQFMAELWRSKQNVPNAKPVHPTPRYEYKTTTAQAGFEPTTAVDKIHYVFRHEAKL